MKVESSADRINNIGNLIGGINRYLEIGVAKGDTFFRVQAQEKHAVDPRFRFEIESRIHVKNEHFHKSTSDEFFSMLGAEKKPFDIIFLDGLHTYNQTLRDFLNSLAVSHDKTIWIIDDTVPTDPIAAEPDLKKVRASRGIMGNQHDETWMGDVYKVIEFINSYMFQYTCLTTEGHGQTIILPIDRNKKSQECSSTKMIEELNYVDTITMKQSTLRRYDEKIILKAIKNAIMQEDI